MKNWAKYWCIAISTAVAGLCFMELPVRTVPSDLRDAMSDRNNSGGFSTAMPEFDRSNTDVPEPAPAQVEAAPTITKVAIIGTNSLTDYYKVDSTLKQLADSTPAFIDKASLVLDEKTGRYKALGIVKLGKAANFDRGADFYGQPTLAFCSGALVSPDMIMTAGHCVSRDPASDSYFGKFYVVFGWKSEKKNSAPESFAAEDVFEVTSVPAWAQGRLSGGHQAILDNYKDYALLVLDRPVTQGKPLAIDRSGMLIAGNRNVFTIGYTMGMPVKITSPGDAVIREIGESMFSTNMDSFGGNSGGPVFDSYSRRIIGIHVTGDARSQEIQLKSDLKVPFRVIENATFDMRKGSFQGADGGAATGVELGKNYYDLIMGSPKAALFDAGRNLITISKSAKIYNNYLEFEIMSCVGFRNYRARPARFTEQDAVMASEEKIPSIIEHLIPLTADEEKICRAIGSRMSNRGVIDPNMMMMYKAARCGRNIAI